MSVEQQLGQVSPSRDTVLTIGTFDGVHRGHQHLFQRLTREASSKGLLAVAVAFRNLPKNVLTPGSKVEYISSWVEREALIRRHGIDVVVPLDFTRDLSLVTAREFVGLLVSYLKMKTLVVGPGFALGQGREGDINTLKAIGLEMGYRCLEVKPKVLGVEPLRSSSLRKLVAQGDVESASNMLGRRFALCGTVVSGEGRGRDIGFPTANLGVNPEQLMPRDGIYATWAIVKGERHPSATSIGVRPTFGAGPRSVETFIMDFDDNLYGETVTLEFVSCLREELTFSTVEELIGQIDRDVEQARLILSQADRADKC